MASDPLTNDLLTTAASIREAGRVQGVTEANKAYFGQSAVRLTAGIFATALGSAAAQMGPYSPLAAAFFAAKALEFEAFATPPSVKNTSPQQDTQGVAVTDQVVIAFAVPMNPDTLTADNVYIGAASGGPHLAATLTYDPVGVTYKLTVSQLVQSEASDHSTARASASCSPGQPLQTDFTMSFST
jgi:hypothetical protein